MTSEVNELTLHTVTGNVKYSGVDYGSQNWKSGGLQIFQRDNGKTFCRMFFSTGNQKTFPVSPHTSQFDVFDKAKIDWFSEEMLIISCLLLCVK